MGRHKTEISGMTQNEYAAHRGISQPRIAKLIKQGKLKDAVIIKGRRTIIDPERADAELEGNLDPTNRPASKPDSKIKPKRKNGKMVVLDDSTDADGNLISESEKKAVAESVGTLSMSYNAARTFHEQYKAALAKLKYDQDSGKLVDVNVVEKAAFDAGRKIRDQIQSIPSRVAALVAAENNQHECKKILTEEFNRVLAELGKTLEAWKG